MRSSRFVHWTAVIFGIFLLLGAGSVQAVPPDSLSNTTHYQVDPEIHPESGQFDVQVKMHFVPQVPTDTPRFLLHRLHKRIAEPDYLPFLQDLLQEDVGTLGGMIDVLRDVTSPEAAAWFDNLL